MFSFLDFIAFKLFYMMCYFNWFGGVATMVAGYVIW